MSLVRIPGGLWLPQFPANGFGIGVAISAGQGTVANDQEEIQCIGYVQLAGGAGSKTFGTSGSGIGWLTNTVTFNAVSTLRVGVKKAATFDNANGPPGRATAGTAAFDVYKDLVAGTDSITGTAWQNTAMASGSGFTVSQGDKIAVCFNLSKSSGTSSIQIRGQSTSNSAPDMPNMMLITSSGTVFSSQAGLLPSVRLTFDDGSIGWISFSGVFSVADAAASVANTNLYGNVIQLPWTVTVDAVAGIVTPAGDFTMGLWSTPAGTPTAMTNGTVGLLAKNMASANARWIQAQLPSEVQLTSGTAYFAGVNATTAGGATARTFDVDAVGDLQSWGLDSNTYAGLSTAGGSVAQQNSGKRRAAVMVRVSQIDIPSGASGMLYIPDLAGT